MKKKVLMSLVLLAIIGTSAVFAQEPTLDKLNLTLINGNSEYSASPLNKDISGAVVIPATHNGKPVTRFFYSIGAPGITSMTIPASVKDITGNIAFSNKFTSVTFLGSDSKWPGNPFGGDLKIAYEANGAGTYTRSEGGRNWIKQGGFTLNGTWMRSDGMEITITENGQNITITGNKPNNGGRLNDTYAKR
jgi:hypothetical protein